MNGKTLAALALGTLVVCKSAPNKEEKLAPQPSASTVLPKISDASKLSRDEILICTSNRKLDKGKCQAEFATANTCLVAEYDKLTEENKGNDKHCKAASDLKKLTNKSASQQEDLEHEDMQCLYGNPDIRTKAHALLGNICRSEVAAHTECLRSLIQNAGIECTEEDTHKKILIDL